MWQSTRNWIPLVCLLVAAGLPAIAEPPTTLYHLQSASTIQRGCFDPCLCPLTEPVPLQGTFGLTPIPPIDGLQSFAVSDIAWAAAPFELQLTGSGTLQIDDGKQRLTLELSSNDGEPQLWDSGFVEVDADLPVIAIFVTQNELYCYDQPIQISASPFEPVALEMAFFGQSMGWTPMAGEATYDVVFGGLGTLARSVGDFSVATEGCLVDDLEVNRLDQIPLPPRGHGYWFLVRGYNGVEGSFDSGGLSQVAPRDAEIAASPGACASQ